jgi:hypothetical protein
VLHADIIGKPSLEFGDLRPKDVMSAFYDAVDCRCDAFANAFALGG